MNSSFLPCVLHASPISLTWSFWWRLAKITNHEAPHYAVFFNLLFHCT
jgi:hypothetical protein